MDIEALKRRINPFGQRSLTIGGRISVRLTLFCFNSTALLILITSLGYPALPGMIQNRY